MKVNKAGLELIKKFEGFKSKPYLCPAGLPTIGYGHVIREGELFTSLTQEEAEQLLLKDLIYYENGIKKLLSVKLNENQFSALVSFAYNLGVGAFRVSTLRQRINRGDFDVYDEFLKWSKCRGKVLKGLLLRRQAEANLFFTQIT